MGWPRRMAERPVSGKLPVGSHPIPGKLCRRPGQRAVPGWARASGLVGCLRRGPGIGESRSGRRWRRFAPVTVACVLKPTRSMVSARTAPTAQRGATYGGGARAASRRACALRCSSGHIGRAACVTTPWRVPVDGATRTERSRSAAEAQRSRGAESPAAARPSSDRRSLGCRSRPLVAPGVSQAATNGRRASCRVTSWRWGRGAACSIALRAARPTCRSPTSLAGVCRPGCDSWRAVRCLPLGEASSPRSWTCSLTSCAMMCAYVHSATL